MQPTNPSAARARGSLSLILTLALPFALLGCGGGGGGGGTTPNPNPGGDTLDEALVKLGVDTAPTPRESAPGLQIESETSPLGNKPKLALTNELLLCNIGLGGSINNDAPMLLAEVTDDSGDPTVEVLFGQDAGQASFLPNLSGSQFSRPAATSAVVAADLDGNGLDEIVFVYQNGIETRVRRYGDMTTAYADVDEQIASNPSVTHVAAVATDLDLDGDDDLVLGLTVAGIGEVTMWTWNGSAFAQVGSEYQIQPDFAPATLTLDLAAGNIDSDGEPELAIAMQEASSSAGSARLVVLDNLSASFAELRSELFVERDQNQVLRAALTCQVDMGDIDGDGVDEIVCGGVVDFPTSCTVPENLIAVYDDRQAGFALVGGRAHAFRVQVSGCNSPTNRLFRTLHVNLFDIDADGVDELSANLIVFDDFVNTAPFTEVNDWRLPDVAIWDNTSASSLFDINTSSFVVGDFTGDDYEDIATYYQSSATTTSQGERVRIYGITALSSQLQELRSIECTRNNPVQGATHPVLLPVNVDLDSPVLSYSEADYKLVFSEPVVLAALAAPPTRSGVGQNVAGSFTAFGNTTSTSAEAERSVTLSVGVTAGVNLDGGFLTQSEFSLKSTLTVAGTRTRGSAYELSKTILFTTAPTEDLVVFATVPIDQYTYTVLSHPDPALIGETVVVSYPRTPVTLQAERGFFNATVPESAIQIDAAVFDHVIGDPTTYPTLSEKNTVRNQRGGLEVGPVGVGQGGGSTEVTLNVGTAISEGGALEVSYESELEVTAGGVTAGLSIGSTAASEWKITSGTSTTYTGVVGAIDAANFAANRYSFGLFTYTQTDARTGQEFQVLNYWVQ